VAHGAVDTAMGVSEALSLGPRCRRRDQDWEAERDFVFVVSFVTWARTTCSMAASETAFTASHTPPLVGKAWALSPKALN
jgi:hypothetical protein